MLRERERSLLSSCFVARDTISHQGPICLNWNFWRLDQSEGVVLEFQGSLESRSKCGWQKQATFSVPWQEDAGDNLGLPLCLFKARFNATVPVQGTSPINSQTFCRPKKGPQIGALHQMTDVQLYAGHAFVLATCL